MSRPVVLFFTISAEPTARRISKLLEAELHGVGEGPLDAVVKETLPHLQALWLGRRPIIALCAAGIVIRALGPLLGDKRAEAPALSVAEDGSSVVPLLGGHRGANALARRIAEGLSGHAAVTTAGDLALGVALDEPPEGWRLENPEAAKPATMALLAGAPAQLEGADWLSPLAQRASVTPRPPKRSDQATLAVSGAPALIYHRQTLALGVGCARNCAPEELIILAERVLAEADLAARAVAGVYSIDVKADEAAVHALAERFDAPARFFSAERLERETPRLKTPSERVFAEVGAHGVAEGAALAAAGADGALLVPKHKSENATCAVARIGSAPEPGRKRGRLSVVGVGPGRAERRTPEASMAIAAADELVGYGLYLDLLGPLAAAKPRAAFALGEEEARCRHALERAGEGLDVALICSGDAGVYAMGALVMELLDRGATAGCLSDAARRAEVLMVPGVSALQAASAGAGALLGHDFCAISLSDLLTPRETILQRVRAAAEGDFVIAFYNPVSKDTPNAAGGGARNPARGATSRDARAARRQSRPPRRNAPAAHARNPLRRRGRYADRRAGRRVAIARLRDRRPAARARKAGGSTRRAATPPNGSATHDGVFHRGRPGRSGFDHRERPPLNRALPGLPLRRIARAGGADRRRAGGGA